MNGQRVDRPEPDPPLSDFLARLLLAQLSVLFAGPSGPAFFFCDPGTMTPARRKELKASGKRPKSGT
jgi:hypothetical protein